MTRETGRGDVDAAAECHASDCESAADFFRYDPAAGHWNPVCERHAREAHPSLEVHAWLESGYLRPVERGRPAGRPADPPGERGAAFRDLVDDAMGW